MIRVRSLLGLAGLGLAAAGCGGKPDASGDVARFLAAALAQDRVAFEARIDRSTVRDDLRRQMLELAHANALDVDGGPSEFALDRMISPQAFNLVDAKGAPLSGPPSAAQVAASLKAVDRGHVCLTASGRCLLTFARSDTGWRLVAMPPPEVTVTVGG